MNPAATVSDPEAVHGVFSRDTGIFMGFFLIYAGVLLIALHLGGARLFPARHTPARTVAAWLAFIVAGWFCQLVDLVASRIWPGFPVPLVAMMIAAGFCAVGIVALVYDPPLRRLPGLGLVYTLVPLALSSGFLFLSAQTGAFARRDTRPPGEGAPLLTNPAPAFDPNAETVRDMAMALRRTDLDLARQQLESRRARYADLSESDQLQYRADSARYQGALEALRRDMAAGWAGE